MKINPLLLLLCVTVARLAAADILSTDTAVFLQPDPKAHVLIRLKSGNTIIYTGDAPAGWRRVEITGTFKGYAHNRDVTKGLEVRVGASILTAPKKDASALTVAQAGDKTEVTGLVDNAPDWCQIKIEKKLQGFIATSANANTPAEVKPAYAVATPAAPAGPVTSVGHAVPMAGNTADMPRLLAGRLVLARRAILNPNPVYDYQMIDSNGRRFAYVDTKRLLLTEKIESYLDHEITVSGTVRNTVDGKDLVIAAESMSLK